MSIEEQHEKPQSIQSLGEMKLTNLIEYYVKHHLNAIVIEIFQNYLNAHDGKIECIRMILYFVCLDAVKYDNLLLIETLDEVFNFDDGLKNTIILHHLKQYHINFYTLEYIIILLRYYKWDKYIVDKIFYNHRVTESITDNNLFILFQSYYDDNMTLPLTNEVHLFLNTSENDFLNNLIRSRLEPCQEKIISIYHKKFDTTVEKLLREHLRDLGVWTINNKDINLQSQKRLCYHIRGKSSKLAIDQ